MEHHDHCLHELRLECLALAGQNAAHSEDAEEVLMLADLYFDFVLEIECPKDEN